METSHQRAERFYLKLLFGTLIVIVLLIALIWGGHDLYARWQEKRLVRTALVAMQRGDDARAGLAARTVLQIKPASVGAARILAELGEKGGNRAALDWRHKVVEREPDSVDDALAWARCAIQFHELRVAEQALAGISEQGKQRADYHAVVATLAQERTDTEKAIAEWELAANMAPDETTYQLQLGTLKIHSANPERHAQGKEILNKLRTDPKQRAAATRALITDGVARQENGQALASLARDLQSYPQATIADRLVYLDFIHQLGSPEYTDYLTNLEASVNSKPAELGALLEWMSRNNLNLLALDYLKGIPRESLDNWPVPMAIANLYTRIRDWRKLEQITANTNWRQGEFMRHAYLARASREQDKLAAAEHEWAAATKEASAQSSSTMMLMRVAADWRWEKEQVELLWSLTSDPEKQKEAVQELYRYYERTNDTQGLYRTLARWAELDPEDLNVQNNLAQVSLLLDANTEEARRIASDLYLKMPSNAAYTTTYAYSLLTKGNAKEAIKVMNSLTAEQLRDPAVSAYYGICLAAVHDEKARDFLTASQQARLLPEEKRLVEKALVSLDSWRRIR